MLTCFKHNPAAQKFFKGALKYEVDETCPTDDVYEQFDYEVSLLSYSGQVGYLNLRPSPPHNF